VAVLDRRSFKVELKRKTAEEQILDALTNAREVGVPKGFTRRKFMRILVNGSDITQGVYAQKRILLDTMILRYAHDRLSPYHAKASLIVKVQ